MRNQYTTGKQVIAGILLISHGLLSCSNPQLHQQDFPDNKLIIDNSNLPSSQKEEELPILLEESNEATINPPFDKQAFSNAPTLETGSQDLGLEEIDTILAASNIPEGKKEINPPVELGNNQAPSRQQTPRVQPRRNASITSDNNNTNQQQEPTNSSDQTASLETDRSRMDLARDILLYRHKRTSSKRGKAGYLV